MRNKIWGIVLLLSLALVVVSGVNVFRLSREYQQGMNEYATLEQYVTVEKEVPQAAEAVEAEAEEETEQEASVIPVSLAIQYDELTALNEHFTGWLYYEPLDISYPVVRGNDNDYYTKYTFENVKNSSGAIFMDFLNKPDYSDYNTIIYGHNMRNGTMFGSLKQLLNDPSIVEENPYFYIYTEETAYMYEIFAVYLTSASSHTYDLIYDEEAQAEYLSFVNETASWRSDREVLPSDRIVTLSTCHGLHSSSRTVVHGVLIAKEDR